MRAITGAALATAGLVLGSTAGAVAAGDICTVERQWSRFEDRIMPPDGPRQNEYEQREVRVKVERCLSGAFTKRRTVEFGPWRDIYPWEPSPTQ